MFPETVFQEMINELYEQQMRMDALNGRLSDTDINEKPPEGWLFRYGDFLTHGSEEIHAL